MVNATGEPTVIHKTVQLPVWDRISREIKSKFLETVIEI